MEAKIDQEGTEEVEERATVAADDGFDSEEKKKKKRRPFKNMRLILPRKLT